MRTDREPKKGLVKRARRWLSGLRAKRRFDSALAARGSVQPGAHEVVLVLDHLRAWRNAGAISRSACVLGARSLVLVGTRYFDPGPAMGALEHVPLRFFDTFGDAEQALRTEGYTLYALSAPTPGSAARFLHETPLPRKTAFIVGNEKHGLSFRAEDFPDVVPLSIAQYGAVPCLNVSVAAGLALYEYVRQHAGRGAAGPPPGDP